MQLVCHLLEYYRTGLLILLLILYVLEFILIRNQIIIYRISIMQSSSVFIIRLLQWFSENLLREFSTLTPKSASIPHH